MLCLGINLELLFLGLQQHAISKFRNARRQYTFPATVAAAAGSRLLLLGVGWMLSTTKLAKPAPAFQKVTTDLINLFYLLRDNVADVLPLALVSVPAPTLQVVVAYLVRLVRGLASIVVISVQEATPISVRTFAGLDPVQALFARWRIDTVAFGVLVPGAGVALRCQSTVQSAYETGQDLVQLRNCWRH